jgi:hypothetical protein
VATHRVYSVVTLRGYPPWLPSVATPWRLRDYSVATPWLPSMAALRCYSVATLLRGYPPWLPPAATLRGYSTLPRGYLPWPPSVANPRAYPVATLRGYPPWLPPVGFSSGMWRTLGRGRGEGGAWGGRAVGKREPNN